MRKNSQDLPPSLMRQYDEMKARHPDAILLFRQNDSYEIYRQDAHKAKDILSLDLVQREIGGVKTDVVSFKEYSLDIYLPKLVRAGMRVAICEQLEDPRQKKIEKESKETLSNTTDMPRKKKEKAPEQEQPKVKAEAKTEVKTEAKAEVRTEQKSEAQQERKPREPQMVTVNGDKVTHGHAFQGKDSQDWYFTAKINGEQLKPQKMDPADLAAYQKKEITVPQLMERYYPTKLMPKVPDMAFSFPNGLAGPDGPLTVNKFNVYKETDQKRDDFGKYKFYAQVGDQKMSTLASRQDLNAYFDRVMTPGDLVTKNFGERLHLKAYYDQFKLPEGIDPKSIRVVKDREANKYMVTVKTGEDRSSTLRKHISYDDGYSFFKTKTASSEQLAAKYLGSELKSLLVAPAMKAEKSASLKM
ncbi:MAG: DNA mismatch repair protein MutS [Bacteroides sp.]|nr:DNA mismatch repair protein MutS [Bacteroides sp.]